MQPDLLAVLFMLGGLGMFAVGCLAGIRMSLGSVNIALDVFLDGGEDDAR